MNGSTAKYKTSEAEKDFLEKLRTNFDVNTDISDVKFANCVVKNYYYDGKNENTFGERDCLLYQCDFSIFHVRFTLKVLAFEYPKFYKVLRLDIELQTGDVEKELETCKNYLQRRRNLNLMFSTLAEFCRYFEARRLIKNLILKKTTGMVTRVDEDGGLLLKYENKTLDVLFGVIWKINWDVNEHFVADYVEVYSKNFEKCKEAEPILVKLTQIQSDFHEKLKLWRSLFQEISIEAKKVEKDIPCVPANGAKPSTSKSGEAESVVVISDSEDDTNVDGGSASKKRKTDDDVSSSVVYTVPD